MKKIFQDNSTGKIITSLILIATLGAILLILIVKSQPVAYWEIALTQKLQFYETGKLPTIMRAISFFGDYPAAAFILIAAAAFFVILGYLREAVFIFLVPLADLFNFLIKILVNRPRPSEELLIIYQKFADPGFPSGHVVHYVVFFGFIFAAVLNMQKLPLLMRTMVAAISATLIILISVSRVYLGAHWPTDVIAGYFVGFFLLSIMLFFYFQFQKPQKEKPLSRQNNKIFNR